ncbi:Uncharacterised protein [Mycobacteroides abscessus]|nr:Uncharacterised protein [Mycobacteroides abscessus]
MRPTLHGAHPHSPHRYRIDAEPGTTGRLVLPASHAQVSNAPDRHRVQRTSQSVNRGSEPGSTFIHIVDSVRTCRRELAFRNRHKFFTHHHDALRFYSIGSQGTDADHIQAPVNNSPRRWLTIYKPNYIAQQCNKRLWLPSIFALRNGPMAYGGQPPASHQAIPTAIPSPLTVVSMAVCRHRQLRSPRHCAGHQPRRQPRDAPRRWYENNPT